jgi:hypothetical protein
MAKKKSDLEKQLEPQARAAGAQLEADGDTVVLSKEGERSTLRVTTDTEQHVIDRYLRGASA